MKSTMILSRAFFLIFLISCYYHPLASTRLVVQQLESFSSQNPALDTLFSEVDRQDHPAVGAIAIHKGEVVYKNSFGSANLSTQAPATLDTKFRLSAISRQFTAFAILFLEEQGKLSIKDDIRKYLPMLPDYEHTITIDHLLSMTSGLSDFWQMRDLIGQHEEDVFTQEQTLKTINKLKPAFEPGEDYIYGHTDLVLLAEIVAIASGQSFPDFMKEHLFDPLGMNNTLIKSQHHQTMENVAESYMPLETGYREVVTNSGVYGPINVYSTINDLAKWELNLLEPEIGSKVVVEKLFESVKLNSGKPIDSWNGQFAYAQQFYHWGHGVKEIYQIGFLGGHASAMFKFPDQEFTVIVLSSGMPYSGYLGMGLAEHFIGEHFFNDEPNDFSQLKTKQLSRRQLQKFAGNYWNERSGLSRKVELINDTLTYIRTDGRTSGLLPLTDNKFQMIAGGKVYVTFEDNNGSMNMNFESATLNVDSFTRIQPVTYGDEKLEKMEGDYYNSNHGIVYTLRFEEGQLIANHPRVGDVRLSQVSENIFVGNRNLLQSIRFNEDASAFTVNSDEIRGLEFIKIQSN